MQKQSRKATQELNEEKTQIKTFSPAEAAKAVFDYYDEREKEQIRRAAELVGEGWEALDKEVKEALVAVEKGFDEVEDAERDLRENVETYQEAQCAMQFGERALADAKAELRFAELRAWLMQMLAARAWR